MQELLHHYILIYLTLGGTSDNVEVAQSLIVRKTTQQESKTFSEML